MLSLPLPLWLYHFNHKPGYTTTQTDNFDVDRFIESVPYWIQESGDVLPTNKTLVFNQSPRTKSMYRNLIFNKILNTLLDEDVKIYVWQAEKPFAITKDNIIAFMQPELIRSNKKLADWNALYAPDIEVKYEIPTIIKNKMASFNVPADELIVVDYFTQRRLLAQMSDYLLPSEVPYLDLNDFELLDENVLYQVIAQAQQSHYVIKGILTNFLEYQIDNREYRYKKLNQIIPQIQVLKKIHVKKENCKQWFELLSKNESFLDDLKELHFSNGINTSQWQPFFRKMKHLKALTLTFDEFTDKSIIYPELPSQLEMLNICSSGNLNVCPRGFANFIKLHQRSLKSIQLTEIILTISLEVIKAIHLPSLEIYKITSKLVPDFTFIGNFKGLLVWWNSTFSLRTKDHRQLDIIQHAFDDTSLINHLLAIPSTKKIIVNGQGRTDIYKSIDLINHPLSLEKLDLGDAFISPLLILKIIQHAKNLKTIDITEHPNKNLFNLPYLLPYSHLFINRYDNKLAPKMPRQVDADTKYNPNIRYNLTRIFTAPDWLEQPHPSLYRLESYQKLIIKNHTLQFGEKPFILTQEPMELIDCEQPAWCASEKEVLAARDEDRSKIRYYAAHRLTLTNTWCNLPSYYAQEKITHLYTSNVKPENIEIKRTQKSGYYCIRAKNIKTAIYTTIHFVIEIPSIKPLPDFLRKIKQYYKEFGDKELNKEGKSLLTGEDYLRELSSQKQGSCRHRAVLGKQQLDKNYIVQITKNACHDYIEVYVDDYLHKVNLGGYPAEAYIDGKKENAVSRSHSFSIRPLNEEVTIDKETNTDKEIATDKKTTTNKEIATDKETIAINEITSDNKIKITTKKEILTESELDPDFITWKSEDSHSSKLSAFSLGLLNKKGKKVLLEMPAEGITGFHLYLQSKCKQINRPVYSINAAKDSVCLGRWIQRINNQGILRRGPGGALHDFLISPLNKQAVIIVNLHNFKSNELANFNSLIDDPRKIDGIPVPNDALVVCLFDPKQPDAYKNPDLFSRFDEKCSLNFPIIKLNKIAQELLSNIKDNYPPAKNHFVIDLLHSPYWRAILDGSWGIQGDKFVFQAGKLEQALSAETIEIRNGHWRDPDFILFWQQFFLQKTNNNDQQLKPVFFKSEGYRWSALSKQLFQVINPEEVTEKIYVLNPTTLGKFITSYEEIDKQLYTIPGLLNGHKNKSMFVELTRDLTESQWARLLTECETKQVQIYLLKREWQCLPQGLLNTTTIHAQDKQIASNHLYEVEVIISNQPINAVTALQQINPMLAVDITECKSGDILTKIDAQWKDETSYIFEEKKAGILRALLSGESLILYGNFLQECIDSLASLCFKNAHLTSAFATVKKPGKLYLITNQSTQFKFISSQCIDYPSRPNNNIAPAVMQTPPAPSSNLDLSLAVMEAFEKQRLELFTKALSCGPTLLIEGPTGVGKTVFMVDTLKIYPEYKVYVGKQQFIAWSTDRTQGTKKILLWDEANIGNDNFTRFNGLSQNTPFVYDGEFNFVTKDHFAVFVYNDISYGGERTVPTFFINHPNKITFTPPPAASFYHSTLKPMLNRLDENTCLKLSQYLLQVYTKVNSMSQERVLMTARELEMIALGILASEQQSETIALQYTYLIAKSVLPKAKQAEFYTWFKSKFPQYKILTISKSFKVGNFLITASRFEAYQLINMLFKVKAFQQKPTYNINFPGLGGMLIEGESAEGKSCFLTQMIKHYGLEEASLDLNKAELGDKYYHLPVATSANDKINFIFKAVKENADLLIDEINTASLQEDVINLVAVGRNLEGQHVNASTKIYGTYNPIYYAGRRQISQAVLRRFIHCFFDPYEPAEIAEIVEDKGLPKEAAASIAQSYVAARNFAQKNNLEPAPNFREIEKKINKVKDSLKLMPSPSRSFPATVLKSSKFTFNLKKGLRFALRLPLLWGLITFVVVAKYSFAIGFVASFIIGSAIFYRNLLHKKYAIELRNKVNTISSDRPMTPYEEGYFAAKDWSWYFKSYVSRQAWQQYAQFAGGMEHGYQESNRRSEENETVHNSSASFQNKH
ncbi:MAG: hypothetical protein JSS07_05985 [Proteobacteria bacterium]|nr:hypothetical protein [Pseudomonadota bacterium]